MRNRIICTSIFILITFLTSAVSVSAQRLGINLSGFDVDVEPFAPKVKESYGLKVIHPYAFPLSTIQQSMASLVFNEQSIFGPDKKRIFKNELIKKIAPEFVSRFKEAGPGEKIAFEIYSRSGKKFIQGDTFLTPQGLHWRFTILDWEKRGFDNSDISGVPWTIVPQDNQEYMKWVWKKSKRVSEDLTNWIVLKNVVPIAANVLPAPLPSTEAESHRRDSVMSIESRLLKLEKLLNEKIITKDEYNSKRKDILEDL
jgi:hypothetical protein